MSFTVQRYLKGEWVDMATFTILSAAFRCYSTWSCARVLDHLGRVIVREAGVWVWTVPSPALKTVSQTIVFADYTRYERFKHQKVTDVLPVFVPLSQVTAPVEFEIWSLTTDV